MPETSPESISFDEALAIEGAERRYTARVHPSWDGPLTTHGGLLAAIALSAIDREVNRAGDKQVRSLTCQYLRPPQHGEIEIHVDPLRSGRRFASARAMILQGGRACVSVLATHSVRELEEIDSWSIAMPDVSPPPDRGAPFVETPGYGDTGDGWLQMHPKAPNFFNHMMIAPRFGAAPFQGPPPDPRTGTENGGWVMNPQARPVDPAWLVFLVDAFWPSVLQPLRVPAGAPTLDLTIHLRALLPPEGLPDQALLVHNTCAGLIGGLADWDARIFARDGSLLALGRQHALVMPFAEIFGLESSEA